MQDRSNKPPSSGKSLQPRFILWLFLVAAFVLVPWTVYLSRSLPPDHLDRRWNLAWSGFDVGLAISLALTAYWGFKKSGWVVVAASAAGSLLLIDAWFDCLTARQGREYLMSMSSALFAELPLSIIAFWLAYRLGKRYFKN